MKNFSLISLTVWAGDPSGRKWGVASSKLSKSVEERGIIELHKFKYFDRVHKKRVDDLCYHTGKISLFVSSFLRFYVFPSPLSQLDPWMVSQTIWLALRPSGWPLKPSRQPLRCSGWPLEPKTIWLALRPSAWPSIPLAGLSYPPDSLSDPLAGLFGKKSNTWKCAIKEMGRL